jgi:hypothetical protein
MAVETVRVYCTDEDDAALTGVLVRVYDSTDVFVTQALTSLHGSEAYAEFGLDGVADPGTQYTIRLSKTQVAFDGLEGTESESPQTIFVISPPTTPNYFDTKGRIFSRPAASDPSMCRCSGFFRDLAGRPLSGLTLRFMNLNIPTIVDGSAILGSYVSGNTDVDGYFVIDLFRGGEYRVALESLEFPEMREILVPDLASTNLVSVLFPVVMHVTYDPDPVATTVDDYVDVVLTVTDSAGNELSLTDEDVTFVSTDTSVATIIIISETELRVYGAGVGTTTITATRADVSIQVVPDVVLESLTVTVTA